MTLTINLHKDKRIDAQYYMKVDKKDEVNRMLQDAKIFVLTFDTLVCNVTEKEISAYRAKLGTNT